MFEQLLYHTTSPVIFYWWVAFALGATKWLGFG